MFPIIDMVIKNNMIYRFENELEQLTKENEPEKQELYAERRNDLQQIISTLVNKKNSHNIKQEKMQTHVAILREKPFQKKWHYLNDSQKIDRLNIYFVANNLSDDLKNKYLEYYKKNGIASKEVSYDHLLARITELNIKNQSTDPVMQPQDLKQFDHPLKAKPIRRRVIKKNKDLN